MYPHNLHNNRRCPDAICRKLSQGDQLIEIILLKDEFIHDVDTDTLNLEKSRKLEETPVATDEKRMYEACRHIDRAVGNILRKCAAHLVLPSTYAHRISTNHIKGWEEKSIYLALPHNWPIHLIDTLRNDAHNYIVKFMEAQLLAPLLPPNDNYIQYLLADADNSLNDVYCVINERLGRDTINPTPFG